MTEVDDDLRRRALETLYAELPDLVYVLSPDGAFLLGNRALAERIAVPWEDLDSHAFDPHVHPDDRDRVRSEFEEAAAGSTRQYVARGVRPDGTIFHVRVVNAPVFRDGEVIAIVGLAHDIDELAGMRTSLDRSEDRLRSTLDSISDAIAFVDAEWRVRFLNRGAGLLLGGEPEQIVGSVLWDLGIPDPDGEVMLREVMATRRVGVRRRFDEDLARWVEVTGFPAGDLLGIQVRDVTEIEESRRRISDDSRRIHAQSTLLDSARDAIILRGLDGVVEYANRATAVLLGADTPVLGRPLSEVLGLGAELAREIEAAIGRGGSWQGDLTIRRLDGSERIVESSWHVVDDPDGAPDAVFCRLCDVTERRRQDEVLLRTQRMESIGTLASGIAHDLNNVLTPLMLSTQLLAGGEQDPHRAHILEGMLRTVERGTAMIRQVLTFARGVDGERTAVDVAALAQRFAEFCRDTLPRNVAVTVDGGTGLHVLGDPTQLLQVLMNLATNARDAMPEGGRLRLTARGSDDRVVIEVADDGTGMPPTVLERIFEPFYTTKGVGSGTGLGLPVSHAIARSHGGSLEATSEPGVGTVFRLELPRVEPPEESTDTVPVATPARLDGLRVLVLDDEEDIVEIAALVIADAGGVAHGTTDGGEARELLAADGFDVVVTDLVMPRITGRQFLDRLAVEHPELPVVAMSGVPEQGLRAAERPNVVVTLDKPFTAQQLVAAILTAAGRG